MKDTIITYETQHGSAKKVALEISRVLDINCFNIDTPFEGEDLKEINNIILVFNFRGPYTAQLTKLYLKRVKDQLIGKNVFLVGEGLFSEKEFPVIAEEIRKDCPCNLFKTYFIKGQLRVETLTKEEKVLLTKFSEITGMEIKDMGELNIEDASNTANSIKEEINNAPKVEELKEESDEIEWICPICGYKHKGSNPPEVCPLCGAPGKIFKKA